MPLLLKMYAIEKIPPLAFVTFGFFLGMVRYYCQFISHFSKMTEPLTQMLQKDVPFIWGDEQEAIFNALFKALSSSHILVHPDFDKPFALLTDASDVAFSEILS